MLASIFIATVFANYTLKVVHREKVGVIPARSQETD